MPARVPPIPCPRGGTPSSRSKPPSWRSRSHPTRPAARPRATWRRRSTRPRRGSSGAPPCPPRRRRGRPVLSQLCTRTPSPPGRTRPTPGFEATRRRRRTTPRARRRGSTGGRPCPPVTRRPCTAGRAGRGRRGCGTANARGRARSPRARPPERSCRSAWFAPPPRPRGGRRRPRTRLSRPSRALCATWAFSAARRRRRARPASGAGRRSNSPWDSPDRGRRRPPSYLSSGSSSPPRTRRRSESCTACEPART